MFRSSVLGRREWRALLACSAVLFGSVHSHADALAASLTEADVLLADSREHASPKKQMALATQLVNRLTPETPPALILDVVTIQANAWIDLGMADKLGGILNAAQALAATLVDPMRVATTKHLAARARFFQGEDRASIPDARDALNAQRDLGGDGTSHPDPSRLYRQLIDHVVMLQSLSLDVESIPHLRLAEKILPSVRDPERNSIPLNNLMASLQAMLGEHERSFNLLESALAKAIAIDDSGWQSALYASLAQGYLDRGDFGRALSSALRVRDLASADNNALALAEGHLLIADAHSNLGEIDAAYASAMRSVAIFDTLDDTFNRADSRREAARCAALLGKVADAKRLFAEMLSLRAENSSTRWAYEVARVRTTIAIAAGSVSEAQRARLLELQLSRATQSETISRQTETLRQYHEVNQREMQLALLQREREVRELETKRDHTRIVWQRATIIATLLLLAVLVAAMALLYRRSRVLRHMAETDALTGVFSRATILTYAARACADAAAEHRLVAACVLDIDHFKHFNDSYGHTVGDEVLTRCVEVMKKSVRHTDAIGRIGGDEFLIVMRDSDERQALHTAERILSAMGVGSGSKHGAFDAHASMSAGVAAFIPDEKQTAKLLVQRADTALLIAKQRGKNRAVAYSEPLTPAPAEGAHAGQVALPPEPNAAAL